MSLYQEHPGEHCAGHATGGQQENFKSSDVSLGLGNSFQ